MGALRDMGGYCQKRGDMIRDGGAQYEVERHSQKSKGIVRIQEVSRKVGMQLEMLGTERDGGKVRNRGAQWEIWWN